MQQRFIPLLLAGLALAACTAQPPPTPSGTDPAPPPSQPPLGAVGPDGRSNADLQDLPAPDGDTVLYFVRNAEDGQTRARMAYWFGFPFELDGRHYFTGFSWDLPAEGATPADPAAGVGLSQATFVARPGNTRDPWKLLGAWSVGTLAPSQATSELDGSRELQSFQTPEGELLLAVPTLYQHEGRRLRDFDLLLFDPHPPRATRGRHWRYVGALHAGQEAATDCKPSPRPLPACGDITGQLSFAVARGEDLPLLQIALSGPAATSRTTQYRYDPQSGQYQRASR